MKTLIALALGVMLVGVPAWGQDADLGARADAARAATAELFAVLKAEVTEAAQSKGAAEAIKVCNLKAVAHAEHVSAKLGMHIGRTSLKIRNPENAPNAWEKQVLEQFEVRRKAGEPLESMEFYEVVDNDGKQQFRYMKAIPLGGVCFNCHGNKIRPDVKAQLDALYPNDQARGFIPGDLRGAFTVTQDM